MENKDIEKLYNDSDIIRYLRSKLPPQEVEEVRQESILEFIKVKNKEKINNYKNYYFKIVKCCIAKYYKKRVITEELPDIESREGVEKIEDILEEYPLLYKKYCGYGWKESGLSQRTYQRKLKKEKEALYNDLCK